MKTAVEWLVNEMPVIDWQDPYWKIKLEKAKEMEKEQIENAFENGMNAVNIHNLEQYYNKTFNQQEQ